MLQDGDGFDSRWTGKGKQLGDHFTKNNYVETEFVKVNSGIIWRNKHKFWLYF